MVIICIEKKILSYLKLYHGHLPNIRPSHKKSLFLLYVYVILLLDLNTT